MIVINQELKIGEGLRKNRAYRLSDKPGVIVHRYGDSHQWLSFRCHINYSLYSARESSE